VAVVVLFRVLQESVVLVVVVQVVIVLLAVTAQQILALAEAQELMVMNQVLVVQVLLSFVINFNLNIRRNI
jgi:hypothetical protein